MELGELKLRKKKMEADIQRAITLSVDSFRLDTGLSPSVIDVDMINVTSDCEERNNFIVGIVSALVEI